jgi:hypothetical protein
MMFGHLGAAEKADVDEEISLFSHPKFFPVSCCLLVPGLGSLDLFD